jgi:hypothetical protein
VASPEPTVGVFTPAGTCPGRLRRHCVIGCADPWTEPVCRKVRQKSGSGEGPGQGNGAVGAPGTGPAAVRRTKTWHPAPGTPWGRRVARPGVPQGSRLAGPDTVQRDSHGRAEWCGNLQIIRLFCKPICKPDAARQRETGETEPTEQDRICPVRRGHHARERQSETGETHVVWLITQRSRVQIPPPLPRPEALSRTEKGPSACGLCTDL